MQEESNFDQTAAEDKELDLLISNGMAFKVPKSALFARFSKKKERTFHIYSPPVAILDLLSKEYLKLELDENVLAQDPLYESKLIVGRTARRMARIVAISVLGRKCYIPFLSYIIGVRNLILINILTNYFALKVDPRKLKQLTDIILQQADYASFIISIRLLSNKRTTMRIAPNPIEKE